MGQKTNALMVCSVVVISMSARHADAQVVVMHSFAGGGLDGKNPNGTLVQLGAELFGLAEAGGSAADGGALFSIGMAGAGYDQLHAFGLGNDGSLPSGSLTLSAANFHGTTEGGGSAGQGTVFRIRGDGTGYGSVHQFVGAPGDGSLPQGSLVISGPNFFGTTGGGVTLAVVERSSGPTLMDPDIPSCIRSPAEPRTARTLFTAPLPCPARPFTA